MENAFSFMLDQFGIEFKTYRNNSEINSLVGMVNREKNTNKKYIGFMPDTDIQKDDILVNSSNEEYFISETTTAYFGGKPHQLKAYYLTKNEKETAAKSVTANKYHIENAYGSVIGEGNMAVINYQTSIEEIKDRVSKTNSPDKEELEKIVSLLEMIVDGTVPASKGLFSKFNNIMEKHSWISSSIASSIIGWLTSPK